jgi:hypothetical protein
VTTDTCTRRRLAVAVVGCTLLWASVALGGELNGGYSQTRDYVSALSGRGATAAYVGMIGLLGFSVAHVAAGLTARTYSRLVTWAFFGAGASGVVVALARISCPNGAARCSVGEEVPTDALDQIHGQAVLLYEIGFLVGVFGAALILLRSPSAGGRARALVLGVLALASVVLLTLTSGDDPGGYQRAWLAVNTVTVLMVAGGFFRPRDRSATVASRRVAAP